MAQRRALVVASGGGIQELPSADSLFGVAQWSFGTGNPSDAAGAQGDYYVASDNKLWSKGATTWTYTGVQYGSSAAVPAKTVPVDADILSLGDSANGYQMRQLTWANMRTALPFREKLTAARTYYVRTAGSDSNDGLANTAGGAFRTIQKAVDVAASLDLGLFDVTIRATGTFAESVALRRLITSGGRVLIRGDASNLTGFVLSPSSGACINTGDGFTGTYDLSYVKFAGSGGAIRGAGGGGSITFSNVDFGTSSSEHIAAPQGCLVQATGPYQISGGAYAHIAAYDGGQARVQNVTVTIINNPSFVVGFALGTRGGIVLIVGVTFSGSATGKKYSADLGGGVLTFGGADYLPGNSAGTATSPGWYA